MTEGPPSSDEEEAWQEVLARWEDESAHQAYLARFSDLEGLALAGRRYRAELEAKPADPAALRWREEVLKRATVQGLAQIPRTRAPTPLPRWARLALAALAAAMVASLLWFAGSRLAQAFGAWREARP
jgi:hypothetical protein